MLFNSAEANETGMLQNSGTNVRKTSAIPGPERLKNNFVAEWTAGRIAVEEGEERKKTDLTDSGRGDRRLRFNVPGG